MTHHAETAVRAALLLAFLWFPASRASAAPQTIVLRSGMVGGVPGSAPTQSDVGPLDDNLRCITAPIDCVTFGSAFTPTDFANALAGPPAELIVPHPSPGWLQSLPSDPDARWVNWNHGHIAANTGSGRPARSVLYAYPFEVPETCNPFAVVEFTWAVDDRLGDQGGGPNPIGVFLNGTPLSGSFAGGSAAAETTVSQSGLLLPPGTNVLYVYQADLGCSVGGIIFRCEIALYPAISICDAADGAHSFCPCSPGDPESGCDIPQGTGGVQLCVQSLARNPNSATLRGTGFPPTGAPAAIVIRGNNQEWLPIQFGDGLRCVGTVGFARLAATSATGGTSLHVIGHTPPSGWYYYQLWFRSTPISYCVTTGPSNGAFNLSNGIILDW